MHRAFYIWAVVLLLGHLPARAQPRPGSPPRPEARPEGKADSRPEGRKPARPSGKARPDDKARPRPEGRARPRPEARPKGKAPTGGKAAAPAGPMAGDPLVKKGDEPPPRRWRRRRRRRRRARFHRRRWRRRRKPFEFRRGKFSIELKAQLQVQAVAFVGKDALYENGDPATDEGVLIRRARLGFEGSLPWDFKYMLMIEAFGDLQRGSQGAGLAGENRGAEILDASITWAKYKMLNIGVGADKVAGAKGRMVRSIGLQLVERPIVIETEEFAIDRRAGAWLLGDFKYFNYHLGFYNGDTGISFGNEGGGYLAAARLEVTPLGAMGEGRPDVLTPSSRLFNKFRMSAGVSFQYQHGPAVDRMALTGDLAMKWHGLSVAAEVLYVRLDPLEDPVQPSLLSEVNQGLAVYAQAGYFILPGRLEVAARFEWMDPNFDVRDPWDIWAVGGAVNYHWTRYIRAQLAYTHKEEMKHSQVENDSFVLQMQVAF